MTRLATRGAILPCRYFARASMLLALMSEEFSNHFRANYYFLLLGAIALSGVARADDCGDKMFYSNEINGHDTYTLIAKSKQIAAEPTWSPSEGEAPVTPGRAFQLAVSWARTQGKATDLFELDEIYLLNVDCGWPIRKWAYVVSISKVQGATKLYVGHQVVGILMDGTVIPPIVGRK